MCIQFYIKFQCGHTSKSRLEYCEKKFRLKRNELTSPQNEPANICHDPKKQKVDDFEEKAGMCQECSIALYQDFWIQKWKVRDRVRKAARIAARVGNTTANRPENSVFRDRESDSGESGHVLKNL
ncbi:uncharacterized protein N7483_008612 [Penicillium malachiteum]|uniref:uncharacterized protein n=1 Tax=Penicillium malachiteum TaxID=1324776 RepID=UPI002547E50B|nr:uncharacterized protein N7483_008612 [Penicillium malachiteum]KAJ5720678.1 hypothetical protein N7483_008612 [Penicillium malachiteum]